VSASSDPVGWLLLRDSHAAPLTGLSPDELKRSCREAVRVPGLPLKHTTGLKAIVGALGFSGDFGNYTHEHWPRVQEFLRDAGATSQANHFVRDQDAVDLRFANNPKRRTLADRLFIGGAPLPSRAFTGYGFDFGVYAAMFGQVSNGWRPSDNAYEPSDLEEARVWLFRNRFELNGGHNYIGDQLLQGVAGRTEFTRYSAGGQDPQDLESDLRKLNKTWQVFRWIVDQADAGWVRILRFNDALIFLVAADGTWDFVWRDLRMSQPTPERPPEGWAGLPLGFQPSWLAEEPLFDRWLYMRRGHWEEKVLHEAETDHYARGGEAGDGYPGTDAITRSYLERAGIDVQASSAESPPERGDLPASYSAVKLSDGRLIGLSPLVTAAELGVMLSETGWNKHRPGDDLEPANPDPSRPAGATWYDALAYCSWAEKKLGLRVRLLTREEHRQIRPFADKHYEGLALGDFPWENFPPRRGLVPAVAWAEPRFLEPGPDLPEFPSPSGLSSKSRKIWIKNWPPVAGWNEPLPCAEYSGATFLDAWDLYEWVVGPWQGPYAAGRYWEGPIGAKTWGAYKNSKMLFRVVVDLTSAPVVHLVDTAPPRQEQCGTCRGRRVISPKRGEIPPHGGLCPECGGEGVQYFDGAGREIGPRRYRALLAVQAAAGADR